MILSGTTRSEPPKIGRSGRHPFPETFVQRMGHGKNVMFALALHRLTGWPIHGVFVQVGRRMKIIDHAVMDDRGRALTPSGIMPCQDFFFTAARDVEAWLRYGVPPELDDSEPLPPGRPRGSLWPIPLDGFWNAAMVCLAASEEEILGVFARAGQSAGAESAAEAASRAILSNGAFLDDAGTRPHPRIGTEDLTLFTRGHCLAFTEALRARPDRSGIPPALVAHRSCFDGGFDPDQEFHAVLLHGDGIVEDAWGRRPLRNMLDQYAFGDWMISTEAYDSYSRMWPAQIGEALAVRLVGEAVRLLDQRWAVG